MSVNLDLNLNLNSRQQKLTLREAEVIQLVAEGLTDKEIGVKLSISPKTVSVYRARVLEKLSLTNNSELTVYAIRNGLV